MTETFQPHTPARFWQCRTRRFDLSRPLIMGIVNVTPDSFSDGGEHAGFAEAIAWGRKLIADGAAILDVGGESTRPGAAEVTVEQELSRVIPVVKALSQEGFAVSVDTSKPEVMGEALAAGAEILNDVRAFELPGADLERICWDAGFGFGKTVGHNLTLLKHTERFVASGRPYLAALSRKSFLGAVTNQPEAGKRVVSSVAAALMAVERGAQLVRVHDVAATREALSVWQALKEAR